MEVGCYSDSSYSNNNKLHISSFLWYQYPEVLNGMPRRWSIHSLYLRDRMADDYDEKWREELISHVCPHKLNYRKAEEAERNSNSYYNHFMHDHK